MVIRNKVIVVGLGPGNPDALSLQAYKCLQAAKKLQLRTIKHPTVSLLNQASISYDSYDRFYEAASDFEEVYQKIVKDILSKAKASQEAIVYAVPGHPLVAERTVQLLLEQAAISEEFTVEIISSRSFIDDMFVALRIDASQGFILLDSLQLKVSDLDMRKHTIITQVYNREVASELKLTLAELYGDDYIVKLVDSAGVAEQESIIEIPICELDRQMHISHLSSVYLAPAPLDLQVRQFTNLVEIVQKLRAPDGCPWDREQSHQTMKPYLVEEAYEVLEAIDNDDMDNLAEELGDVLLHVVMHGEIAREAGNFSLEDVFASISTKMIRRHPHVFGEANVHDSQEVMQNWEEIKLQEKYKHGQTERVSVLSGIPRGLPMLMVAYKMQKKAARVGFDWVDVKGAWQKLLEEAEEVKQAQNKKELEHEVGDLIFAAVNVARLLKVEPEQALARACRKFERRFSYIEQIMAEKNLDFSQVDLEWLEKQWQCAKKNEKKC